MFHRMVDYEGDIIDVSATQAWTFVDFSCGEEQVVMVFSAENLQEFRGVLEAAQLEMRDQS